MTISAEAKRQFIRDIWSIRTWTWVGNSDKTLSWLVTVDASVFDGNAELTQEAIAKTLEKFETSLRAKVSDHRENKWNGGVRPPRPKTRKTAED